MQMDGFSSGALHAPFPLRQSCMFGGINDNNNSKTFHRFEVLNHGAAKIKQRLVNFSIHDSVKN